MTGVTLFHWTIAKIFNGDKIQDISLTTDNVLNILIYRLPFCVIVYTNFKLKKMVQFLWPTSYIVFIRCFALFSVLSVFVLYCALTLTYIGFAA